MFLYLFSQNRSLLLLLILWYVLTWVIDNGNFTSVLLVHEYHVTTVLVIIHKRIWVVVTAVLSVIKLCNWLMCVLVVEILWCINLFTVVATIYKRKTLKFVVKLENIIDGVSYINLLVYIWLNYVTQQRSLWNLW